MLSDLCLTRTKRSDSRPGTAHPVVVEQLETIVVMTTVYPPSTGIAWYLLNQGRDNPAAVGHPEFSSAPPLNLNSQLYFAAAEHDADMAGLRGNAPYFAHDSPDGTKFYQRTAAAGYPASAQGECIGMGYVSAADIVNGWQDSPPHAKIVFSTSYNEVGVDFLPSSNGSRGTADFGRRSGVTAIAGLTFKDLNSNGPEEQELLSGVVVTATSPTGSTTSTVSQNGYYQIPATIPGVYRLNFSGALSASVSVTVGGDNVQVDCSQRPSGVVVSVNFDDAAATPGTLPPVAVNDQFAVAGPMLLPLLANDLSSAGGLRIADVSAPLSGGRVTVQNGGVYYVPPRNFVGTDRFSYWVTDASGLRGQATVDVTKATETDPPQLVSAGRQAGKKNAVVIAFDEPIGSTGMSFVLTTAGRNGVFGDRDDRVIVLSGKTVASPTSLIVRTKTALPAGPLQLRWTVADRRGNRSSGITKF